MEETEVGSREKGKENSVRRRKEEGKGEKEGSKVKAREMGEKTEDGKGKR